MFFHLNFSSLSTLSKNYILNLSNSINFTPNSLEFPNKEKLLPNYSIPSGWNSSPKVIRTKCKPLFRRWSSQRTFPSHPQFRSHVFFPLGTTRIKGRIPIAPFHRTTSPRVEYAIPVRVALFPSKHHHHHHRHHPTPRGTSNHSLLSPTLVITVIEQRCA